MKHKSLYGLVASHTFKNLVICCLGLTVVQMGIVFILASEHSSNLNTLEGWFDHPGFRMSYAAGMAVILFVSDLQFQWGSKVGYTMFRLGKTNKEILWVLMQNGLISYLTLWGVQVLILFGVSHYYLAVTPPEFTSVQTIFLANLRSDFFHMVIPNVTGLLWMRNLAQLFLLTVLFGVSCLRLWQGRDIKFVMCAYCVAIQGFSSNYYGETAIFYTIVYLVLGYILLKGGLKNEEVIQPSSSGD
ncbi:MAG: hypothetical protein R3Y07_05445 [Eubacteriales bacterium]